MNKEFVPYELALELKQLGFDEPCFAIYYNPSKELFIGGTINPFTKEIRTLAPTYSQAFRWFREKYNLLGYVSQATISKGKVFMFSCNEGNDTLLEDIDSDFKTYEEAELACLEKLIQIINENKL